MKQISTIDIESIRRNPTNNSSSKFAYPFSKSKRFPEPNPECPNAFYSYDSQLSNRKTSFGYGKKFDFSQIISVSPPSTKYESKSFLDESKKKGKSFGLGRDYSPDRSYLMPQLHKNPGPGKYDNQKTKQNNLSFTFRGKHIDVIEKNNTQRYTPSPFAYNTIDLQPKNGRFMYSKYNDSKLCTLAMKSDRFEKIKQTPGPNHYAEKDCLTGNAKYILSNHHGNGTRAFSQTSRFGKEKWSNFQNPGPGNYELTSDFGMYGDAKYYKTLSGFKEEQS